MKLIALPVNVGDSFLLRDEDKVILVDGGMNKQHIMQLLHQENIPNYHIDLLVCTHYDADHINGIIGILESQEFTFKELWLPEILGSIGYTLSKKIGELLKAFRKNDFQFELQDSEFDSIFKFNIERNQETEQNSQNDTWEYIDIKVLDDFINHKHFWYFEPFWHYHNSDINYKMLLILKSTASVISNAVHSGAYIRWFKYSGYEHKSYGFDLYSENAVQTDITIYNSKSFFSALYHISLSNINKYSLVYMYQKENLPNILFSADSDLHFYKQVTLKNNSIVTAPHHGSSANDCAYNKISGNDLIFVRSDRSQVKRPGIEYLKQSQKYCTICRNITAKQKIELNYNGLIFITNAKVCKC